MFRPLSCLCFATLVISCSNPTAKIIPPVKDAEKFGNRSEVLVFDRGIFNLKTKQFNQPPKHFGYLSDPAPNGLMIAQPLDSKLYGYVDTSGAWVIPANYSSVEPFSGGLGLVKKGGEQYFINDRGERAFTTVYSDMSPVSEGLIAVRNNETNYNKQKYGYVNTKGQEVLPLTFDQVSNFKNGLAYVEQEPYYFFINTKGKTVGPTSWQHVKHFSHGLAAVKKDGKWGFMDTSGKVVIKPTYMHVANFNRLGVASVKIDGKWGLIDRKGTMLIAPKQRPPYRFNQSGYAIVRSKRKEHLIDTSSTKIGQSYQKLGYIDDDLYWARVSSGRLDGIIKANGQWVVPEQFETIGTYSPEHKLLQAWRGGSSGRINLKGEWVIRHLKLCGTSVYKNIDDEIVWPLQTKAEICIKQ